MDIKDNDDIAQWTIVTTIGNGPGKRYGHTLNYVKPFLIVFGGNTGTSNDNDVWILATDTMQLSWVKLDIESEALPNPRVYHAAGLCTKGNAQGMLIIFGGRDSKDNALNDAWGLRKHRDGRWDWIKAPYKNEVPKSRYNVYKSLLYSIIFFLLVT